MGWLAGSCIDSEDTLSFIVSSGFRSMNEVFPLESAAEAFDLMMNGKARFRAVLTTGHSDRYQQHYFLPKFHHRTHCSPKAKVEREGVAVVFEDETTITQKPYIRKSMSYIKLVSFQKIVNSLANSVLSL